MSRNFSLLASTLGLVSPRYRTLGQWVETYREIIEARPLSYKTKANRYSALTHLMASLGARVISAIRPHEVAGMVNRLAEKRPQTAKRVLMESKDVFNEAVSYGWIDRNPAAQIKAPHVKVQRHRLTIEAWLAIRAHAQERMPPWVSRMLVLALVTGQRRSDLCKMRFADVWDDHLHIEQAKTGARLALPLALKLNAIDTTLEQAIDACRGYATGTEFMLRKHNGKQLVEASLSARFEEAREESTPACTDGLPVSLHECRSLSERLYRAQGINTMVLLGHKNQAMTDIYNDDRGLSKGQWKTLKLIDQPLGVN